MSSRKNNQNSDTDQKIKTAYIASSVLLVVLLVVGLVSYFYGKKQGEEQGKNIVPIISVKEVAARSSQVKGAETISYNGRVTKVENGKIYFSTQVKQVNGASAAKEIAAVVNSNTQLFRLDLSQAPTPGNTSDYKQKIPLSELKNGDQIVVQSENDSADDGEIIASIINLLISSGT
jgi:hypothetical protein